LHRLSALTAAIRRLPHFPPLFSSGVGHSLPLRLFLLWRVCSFSHIFACPLDRMYDSTTRAWICGSRPRAKRHDYARHMNSSRD
jgi:hypothetical protein